MRRLFLSLIFLFSSTAYGTEVWYFRDGTGEACGPGTRKNLSLTQGSTDTQTDVTSELTWNRAETARTIQSGNWIIWGDFDTTGGGGPPGRVTCVVERYNSSCSLQETIFSDEVTTSSGGSDDDLQFYSGAANGEITFSSGDFLVIRCVRSNSTRTINLRHEGSGSAYNTRLIAPDEAAAGGGGEFYRRRVITTN